MFAPPHSDPGFYQHAAELLGIHEALLNDEPRNRAFAEALRLVVTPESAVLDLGSGTGLWAILAAKLGARKVVAVEREGLMCGAIRMLARANGVEDLVEIIHGEATAVELPREFDVVVSETVGHMIFEEQIASIMIAARTRLLKPGGALIPNRVSLVAAPVHLKPAAKSWPAGIDLDYQPFHDLAFHRPLALTDKSGFEFLAMPAELTHCDLTTDAALPDLRQLRASWDIADTRRLDGVAVWANMSLADAIELSTLDTPSWSATVFRLSRFSDPAGILDFHLQLDAATNHWNASLGGKNQRHSPAIAATRMALQQAAPSQMLPHLPVHGGGPVLA